MINKIISLSYLLILASFCATAQIKQPVNISFESTKNPDATYDIVAKLDIDKGWHVYTLEGGDGPVSTSLDIQNAFKGKWVNVIGTPKEKGKKISKYEDVFESNVNYFEDNAKFILTVKKVKKFERICIPVSLEYMICNDSECLPPTTKTACVILK